MGSQATTRSRQRKKLKKVGLCPEGGNRTQPGILTPGTHPHTNPPCKGGRVSVPKFVRHLLGEEPSYRPVGAGPFSNQLPGVKPRAESCCPFGAETEWPRVFVILTRMRGRGISGCLHPIAPGPLPKDLRFDRLLAQLAPNE